MHFGAAWPALAVLGACLAWALDNNLTRKVSLNDATWLAATKGLVAGSVNLLIASHSVTVWPAWPQLLAAGAIGWLAYGVSLALFVIGLRHLGTARTGTPGIDIRWPKDGSNEDRLPLQSAVLSFYRG